MKQLTISMICVFILLAFIGCSKKGKETISYYFLSPGNKPSITFEVRKAEQQQTGNLEEVTINGQQQIYLHSEVLLTNDDISKTSVEMYQIRDEERLAQVDVYFTPEGSDKLAEIAATHMNKPIAIVLNGKVVSCPVIVGQTRGVLAITNAFQSRKKAESVAKGLVGQ
jgi:preprotein translocase subunit SecD